MTLFEKIENAYNKYKSEECVEQSQFVKGILPNG